MMGDRVQQFVEPHGGQERILKGMNLYEKKNF